jgi:hypothetical protein
MSQTLTAAVEAVQTKEAELLQLLTDSVSPVLEAIAQMGTVGVIYVYGYTPGFNDGEPCEHDAYQLIGLSGIDGEEKLDEFLSTAGLYDTESEALSALEELPYKSKWQDDSAEEIAEYEATKARLYSELATDLGLTPEGDYDSKVVNSAISNVVIPALDREFTTNYQVVYIFKDGTFTRHVDDYDCGY